MWATTCCMTRAMGEHNVTIRCGRPNIHRDQAIVERFNGCLVTSMPAGETPARRLTFLHPQDANRGTNGIPLPPDHRNAGCNWGKSRVPEFEHAHSSTVAYGSSSRSCLAPSLASSPSRSLQMAEGVVRIGCP